MWLVSLWLSTECEAHARLRTTRAFPGVSTDDIDSEFFIALEDELEKVNLAFLERCKEVEAALDDRAQAAGASSLVRGVPCAALRVRAAPCAPAARSSHRHVHMRVAPSGPSA